VTNDHLDPAGLSTPDPHTADHPVGAVHVGAGTCDDGHAAGILLFHEFLVFGVYPSRNSPGVPSAVEA
jgi:hypothetical protein